MNFVIEGQISSGEPSCLGARGLSVWCDEPPGNLAMISESPLASPKLSARTQLGSSPLPLVPKRPWDASHVISLPSVSFPLSTTLGLSSSIW